MNDSQNDLGDKPMTQEEMHAALFAQMVMQFSSTALILMGRAPNPVTGKTETDLDAARLFVDQLEMLEAKTKGNLGADEQHLLKQNLMTVRMAFVQAVEEAKQAPPAANTDSPAEPKAVGEETGNEGKKKFSKSYGSQ